MLDLIRQRAQSWGVKIAFGIIIIVFVFWGVGASTQTGPGVVATVNGKPILHQDFYREVSARENEVRAMAPDLPQESMRALRIPEQSMQILVSRELIRQEAERIGMSVTPLELFHFLKGMPAFHDENGAFNQKKYEEAVSAQGRGIVEFEQTLMRDMLGEKMRLFVSSAVAVSPEEARRRADFMLEKRVISYVLFATENYRKDVAVSEDAIKKFYDENQPQFLEPASTTVSYVSVTPASLAPSVEVEQKKIDEAFAKGPSRYNLRQIVLGVPAGADEAKEKEIREKLEAVAKEIRKGKDFAEAAKEISEDPSGAAGSETGWIPSRHLSPEILGALAGLPKNGVTAPVRIGEGYALLQVADAQPDWSLSEAEIKSALRDELALEAASLAFRDVQGQAEDLVALGKPLSEIAQELKIASTTTNPVPREDLPFVLGLRKPGQAALFNGAKGSLVSAILETREGFLVAEIADQKEAAVRPLESVREIIVDILTQREAEKRAEEAARKAAGEFAMGIPDAYKADLVTSEAFARQGEIPGIGYAKPLTDAAFSAPIDTWIMEPFATPKGAVVAMPVEIVALKDEDWDRIEKNIMQSLLEAKRNQVFSAYVADLGQKAEVRITDPAIFEE